MLLRAGTLQRMAAQRERIAIEMYQSSSAQIKPYKILETIQHYQELAEKKKAKSQSKKQKPSK
jgi:hypothetical protein